MAIFVISDTHFGHKNIIKFERTQFKTIEEHDETIIRNWNRIVTSDDDIVFHLGDVGLTKGDYLKSVISRLRGHKILIMGNHDRKNTSRQFFLDAGFEEVYDKPYFFNSRVLFSHEPAREAFENFFIINVHGHLHGSILALKNFINVSCKYTNFGPINIEKILKKLPPLKDRDEKFLEEWYAPFYKFDEGTDRTDIAIREDGIINLEESKKMRFEKSKNQDKNISENDYLTFVGLPIGEGFKPLLQICEKYDDIIHQVTPCAKVMRVDENSVTCKYHGHEYSFKKEEIGVIAWKYQRVRDRESSAAPEI